MANIPKMIHYCWFGGGEKTKLMSKCMISWKKYFPDYSIIEWNEENFDVYQNEYIREAYEKKKWAFVSDYARLAIIYEHGGIYFDTDVEVIKNFEHLISDTGYMCFENHTNDPYKKTVNTGLGFAAEPHNRIIKIMMEDYENRHFIVNGELDLTPCPILNTAVLEGEGLIPDGTQQQVGNMVIYPFEYFCGYDIANSHPVVNGNTYTVHHYAATWSNPLSIKDTIKYKIVVKLIQKVIGYSRYDQLKKLLKG